MNRTKHRSNRKRQVNDHDITRYGVTVAQCFRACIGENGCKRDRCDCSAEDNDKVVGCMEYDCGRDASRRWRRELEQQCPTAFFYPGPSNPRQDAVPPNRASVTSQSTSTRATSLRTSTRPASSSASSSPPPAEESIPIIRSTLSQEISQQQEPSPASSSTPSVEQTSETGSASQSESTSSTSLSSANTPSPGLARSSSPSASAAFSASTSFPVSSVSSSQTAEGPNGQVPDLSTSKGPEDRSEWSAGSIAGMVLGILGVIVIFLAFLRWLRWKRRRNVNADTFASAPPTYDSQAPGERNMPRFGNAQHGIMPGQGHTGTSVLAEKEYYFRPYVVNPSPPSESSTPSYRPRAVSGSREENGVVQWQGEVAQNASGDTYVDESKSDIFIGSQSIIWSERSLPSTLTIDLKSQRLEEEEEYRGEEQQGPETRAQSTRANSVDLAWVFAEDAHKSAPAWAPPRRRPSVRSKHSTATRSTGRRPSIATQSIMSGRSGSTAAYTYRSGSSMPSVSLTRASSRLMPKVLMAPPASQMDL